MYILKLNVVSLMRQRKDAVGQCLAAGAISTWHYLSEDEGNQIHTVFTSIETD